MAVPRRAGTTGGCICAAQSMSSVMFVIIVGQFLTDSRTRTSGDAPAIYEARPSALAASTVLSVLLLIGSAAVSYFLRFWSRFVLGLDKSAVTPAAGSSEENTRRFSTTAASELHRGRAERDSGSSGGHSTQHSNASYHERFYYYPAAQPRSSTQNASSRGSRGNAGGADLGNAAAPSVALESGRSRSNDCNATVRSCCPTWLRSPDGQAAAISLSRCCLRLTWPCLFDPDPESGATLVCMPFISRASVWACCRQRHEGIAKRGSGIAGAAHSSAAPSHGSMSQITPAEQASIHQDATNSAEGGPSAGSDQSRSWLEQNRGSPTQPEDSSGTPSRENSSSAAAARGHVKRICNQHTAQTNAQRLWDLLDSTCRAAARMNSAASAQRTASVQAVGRREGHLSARPAALGPYADPFDSSRGAASGPASEHGRGILLGSAASSSSTPPASGRSSAARTDSQYTTESAGLRKRAEQRRNASALRMAAAVAGLEHMASTDVPVAALALTTVLAMCLDLLVGPGRGSNKALSMWILWPILAPLDYDKAAVPWAGMQFAYIAWSLGLFLTISFTGDAWPLGRADLDFLPEEHRYSFSSPLGLNGLGVVADLISYSLFVAVAFPVVMGLDHSFYTWRTAAARQHFRKEYQLAIRQQQVIIDSVVDQVPPFAQECMEAGVMAFEARPVVMAVAIERQHAPVSNEQFCDQSARTSAAAHMTSEAELLSEFLDVSDSGREGAKRTTAEVTRSLDSVLLVDDTISGFFTGLARYYRDALQSPAAHSRAVSSLGVLTRDSREALDRMATIDWDSMDAALGTDKIRMQLDAGYSSKAIWVCLSGLRTPVRDAPVAQPAEQRYAQAFSLFSALLRFAEGCSTASSRGTQLRAGIAYPSSSRSAMVVGLLGLKQQPQEWATFGGGLEFATRLATGLNLPNEHDRCSDCCHVANVERSNAMKVFSRLQSLRGGLEGALQWRLAIASANVHPTVARPPERNQSILAQQQLAATRSVLDAVTLLISWLEAYLQPSDLAVSASAASNMPSSSTVGLKFLIAEHRTNNNSSDDSYSLATIIHALYTIVRAAKCGDLVEDLVEDPSSFTDSSTRLDVPKWVQEVLGDRNAIMAAGDMPTSSPDSESIRHMCLQILDGIRGPELAPITATVLPGIETSLRENNVSKYSHHSKGVGIDELLHTSGVYGLPLLSGLVMACIGGSLMYGSLSGALQVGSLEFAAEGRHITATAILMKFFLPFTPRVAVGACMVVIGLSHHASGTLVPPWVGYAMYAAVVFSMVVFRTLWYLEVVYESCYSRFSFLSGSAPVLAATVLAVGVARTCGDSAATFAIALFISLVGAGGPFAILQAGLEGTVTRANSDAAATCTAVLAPNTRVRDGIHRVDVIMILRVFVGAFYVLHFVIISLARSKDVLQGLDEVKFHAARAKYISAQAKRRLEFAASELLPLALIRSATFHDKYPGVRGLMQYQTVSQVHPTVARPAWESTAVSASLGSSVVATLVLGGFESISELAGPVATFGLHRKIGAIADEVCSRYGCVRMQSRADRVILGWFASNLDSIQNVLARSQAKSSWRITKRNWRFVALVGAHRLLHEAQSALYAINSAIRPAVGIATGRVRATSVGQMPASILYSDDQSRGHRREGYPGPIVQSISLAETAACLRKTRHGVPGSCLLSAQLSSMISLVYPWMAVALANYVTNAPRNMPPPRVLDAEVFEDEVNRSYDRDQLTGAPPDSIVTGPTYHTCYVRCRIECDRNGSPIQARAVGKIYPRHTLYGAWQAAWLARLRSCVNNKSSDTGFAPYQVSPTDGAVRDWLQQWCQSTVESGTGRAGPTRQLIADDGACLCAAFAPSPPGGTGEVHARIYIIVRSSSAVDPGLVSLQVAGGLNSTLGPFPRFQMNEFKRLKVLGEGGFARVYQAVHLSTGKQYALKVGKSNYKHAHVESFVRQSYLRGNHAQQEDRCRDSGVVRDEILAMLRCAGLGVPGISRLGAVVVRGRETGILMEYIDGIDLEQTVRSRPGRWRMREGATREIARQLICTLAGMHRAGVLHRDIKPSNVVIDSQGCVFLIDFGLADLVKPDSGIPADANAQASNEQPAQRQLTADDLSSNAWMQGSVNQRDELRLVFPLLSPAKMSNGREPSLRSLQPSDPASVLVVPAFTGTPMYNSSSGRSSTSLVHKDQVVRVGQALQFSSAGKLSVSVLTSGLELHHCLRSEPDLFDCILAVEYNNVAPNESSSAPARSSAAVQPHRSQLCISSVNEVWTASRGEGGPSSTKHSNGLVAYMNKTSAHQWYVQLRDNSVVFCSNSLADCAEYLYRYIARMRVQQSAVDGQAAAFCSRYSSIVPSPSLLRSERAKVPHLHSLYPHGGRAAASDDVAAGAVRLERSGSSGEDILAGSRSCSTGQDRRQKCTVAAHYTSRRPHLDTGRVANESVGSRHTADDPSGFDASPKSAVVPPGSSAASSASAISAELEIHLQRSYDSAATAVSAVSRWARTAVAGINHHEAQHDSGSAVADDTMFFEHRPFNAEVAGTPLFMAPELVQQYGERASDYWSLGVTLFWLLAGRMPFEGRDRHQIDANAKAGRIAWHVLPADLSPACLDALRGLLEVNTDRRYGARQMKTHPWLRKRAARMSNTTSLQASLEVAKDYASTYRANGDSIGARSPRVHSSLADSEAADGRVWAESSQSEPGKSAATQRKDRELRSAKGKPLIHVGFDDPGTSRGRARPQARKSRTMLGNIGSCLVRCHRSTPFTATPVLLGDEHDAQAARSAMREHSAAARPRTSQQIRVQQSKYHMVVQIRAILELYVRRLSLQLSASQSVRTWKQRVADDAVADLLAAGVSQAVAYRSIQSYKERAIERQALYPARDNSYGLVQGGESGVRLSGAAGSRYRNADADPPPAAASESRPHSEAAINTKSLPVGFAHTGGPRTSPAMPRSGTLDVFRPVLPSSFGAGVGSLPSVSEEPGSSAATGRL